MLITLRDYQDSIINDVRKAFAQGNRAVIMQLATGAGKTVCFASVVRAALARGNRTLILAHRDQLIKQASAKLHDYNVEHGIIMAGHTPEPYKKVQVASIQTMVRRIQKFKYEFELIVVDEAHLSAAKSFMDVFSSMPEAIILGVTGTPGRLDGRGLGRSSGCVYDTLVSGISMKELIARGYLVKPRLYTASKKLDLSKVRTMAGDYNDKDLADVVDRPVITGSAIAHYEREAPGRPALAWCINIKHAEQTAATFNEAGIKFAVLSGKSSSEERDATLAALAKRKISGIAFCQLLIEGVDVPSIGALIMLRPTKSLTAYLQVCGRGLRPDPSDPSKKDCIILDHAGLFDLHGLPEWPREWPLEGRQKKKNQGPSVPVMQCPVCYFVFEPADFCPSCGASMRRAPAQMEQVEGTLKEVTAEEAERVRLNRKREVAMADSLEELERIGHERGYDPTWAKVRWGFRKQREETRQEEVENQMNFYEQLNYRR